MTAESWENLMERVVAEERGDYLPGDVGAPGSGTEGDDPLGLKYADYGPLAYVLCEAMDSAVTRGMDRPTLLEQIAQSAGEGVSVEDVTAVLTDENREPAMELLSAFANTLDIDAGILLDAAQRGGAKNLGPISTPPL